MTSQALFVLGAGTGPMGMNFLVTMGLMIAIFYFMLIRPQKRKERERKDMIGNIKSGEKVMFSGGILGTVTNVKENTFMVKVADGVKIEVARAAVSRVLEKGEKVGKEEDK